MAGRQRAIRQIGSDENRRHSSQIIAACALALVAAAVLGVPVASAYPAYVDQYTEQIPTDAGHDQQVVGAIVVPTGPSGEGSGGDPGNGAGSGGEESGSPSSEGAPLSVLKSKKVQQPAGEDAHGALPFTDYPITLPVWLALFAVLGCLLVATGLAAAGRARRRQATS